MQSCISRVVLPQARATGRASLRGATPATLTIRSVFATLLCLTYSSTYSSPVDSPAEREQPAPAPSPSLPGVCPASRQQQAASQLRVARLLAHVSPDQAAGAATMSAGDASADVLHVERVPCLQDNYSWLIHEPRHNSTAVVDPAEVAPVIEALKAKKWKLTHVLNTHHHWDHTGGNEELKKLYGCTIVGPAADRDRIPGIDVALKDGDTYQFGAVEMRVLDTPGHTRGHITLWFPQGQALFPGDTLFALGCGRLFEGTPAQMWDSLSKLLRLPPETQVYCAHEYTQSNARFAIHADPENVHLQRRKAEIDDMRSKGIPTVPSLLGDEFKTNPFLRPDDHGIRKALGIHADASSAEAFGKIRAAKDTFR